VIFADLGMVPLANAFIDPIRAQEPEAFFPLCAYVCDRCFLVQVGEVVPAPSIFDSYLYFSSYSDGWLEHCSRYAHHIVPRLGLTGDSHVVEIASNDGALLGILRERGLNVLGIEPAVNVAKVAMERGIPTEVGFFGRELAMRLRNRFAADLIVANNVLAHVHNLNDFVCGLKLLLAPHGTVTIEIPHILQLISQRQFDTIYHEHISYFSLLALQTALSRYALAVFDVETLAVHGGSIRLYVCHAQDSRPALESVSAMQMAEQKAGLDQIMTYSSFASVPVAVKCDVLDFFLGAQRAGKRVVGYAAAAKGNTLLNYCGIGREFIDYVIDKSPHKQGLLLPGTHIEVKCPRAVFETKPNYLFILAWNWSDEIMRQMGRVREWGGQFVVPVPHIEIF